MNATSKRMIFVAGAIAVLAALVANEFRVAADPELPGIAADAGAPSIFLYRLQTWIAAIATLAVFSFLFRENPFYRTFEHALIGCATGYSCAVVTRQVLYEKWFDPMIGGFRAWGTTGMSWPVLNNIMLIIPGIIGICWYFQYSKKYLWVSRIAMCVTLGAGAGLAFKGTFNQLLPQITGTFKSVWPGDYILPGATLWERAQVGFENLVFVAGTVSVLAYFFFAFGRKNWPMKSSARLGRWYLMIALGAFFGNTFMTRLSALIERVHFLAAEWLRMSAL